MSAAYNVIITLFTLHPALCGYNFVTDMVNFEATLAFAGMRQNLERAHS
jgi:hypothetical protein